MKDNIPLSNKLLIPCIIVLTTLLATAVCLTDANRSSGDVMRIYQAGELKHEVELSRVSETYTIDLDTNEISIGADGVSMKSADCPDKLCIKQGSVSKAGESIICLPNKIIIEIDGTNGEVDAIAR